MKKINILSAIILLFAAIGFTSCDSEPVDPLLIDNGQQQNPALFKVDFSGETYVATSAHAVIADGLIVIEGARGSNGESVYLAIPGTTTGTYSGDDVLMTYDPTGDQEYQYANFSFDDDASTGSVVITSINTTNHTISGTFNFVGYWSNDDANLPSIAFTNGSFQNIPYTGNVVGPVDDDEFMTATVDGVDKNYSVILAVGAGDMLTFSGTIVSPSSSIQFAVPANITPGTYSLAEGGLNDPMAMYHGATGTFPYTSVSGSLTITSNANGFIEGTFEFTAEDPDGASVEVTDGEFRVELP